MSNVISFEEYALSKDPEQIWVKRFSEAISPYFSWNHTQMEFELVSRHYYRVVNGLEEKSWIYEVDCFVGVPEQITLFHELDKSYVTCIKIPLGVLVQLGLNNGNSYPFCIVLERKKDDEDTDELMLVHTNLYNFFQTWIDFDDAVRNGEAPFDDDPERFKEMYLDYDIENAWAKKQNIALRLHQKKHDELKTKYLHQALTVAIMLSEENDLFFNSKFSEKGSGILASTKHKNPTIETLWSLGNELDEDFSHYFPNVEVFTGELVFEVELWSPELTWMIKDPESKSRWDYAKLALDNSGIKYEDLDMHTDDDEDLDN